MPHPHHHHHHGGGGWGGGWGSGYGWGGPLVWPYPVQTGLTLSNEEWAEYQEYLKAKRKKEERTHGLFGIGEERTPARLAPDPVLKWLTLGGMAVALILILRMK